MIEKKYYFSDFTWKHYREILQLAKDKFQIRFFHDFNKDEQCILFRHDVDLSVPEAVRMAGIEAEAEVKSTYFFHLHNEFYNLLEADVVENIRSILNMGHQLGLHFDSHFYGIDNEEKLAHCLEKEKGLLEDIFGKDVRVFSFHNTTPFTMSCQKDTYAGMINTYAEYFQTQMEYCSDTNGYWRFKRLFDVLDARDMRQVQVLTHPVWWTREENFPKHKVWRFISSEGQLRFDKYNRILEQFNRENIGELNDTFDYLKSIDPLLGAKLEQDWLEGFHVPVFLEVWRLYDRKFREIHASSTETCQNTEYPAWQEKRNRLINGLEEFSREELKNGILAGVKLIQGCKY